jgi:hypothetical protein
MKSLHEVGIAAEGWQRGRLIGLEEVAERLLLGLESGALLAGHVVLEVTPDLLDRLQRRAIGRQAHQAPVRREPEQSGRLGPSVVQQEAIQAVGEGLYEGVDDERAQLGVQLGPRQREPVARGGLDGALDVEPRQAMLDEAHRLRAPGGEAPPSDGQEAEAAFVLAEARPRRVFSGGMTCWRRGRQAA